MRAYEPHGSNYHDERCCCPGCSGDPWPENTAYQVGQQVVVDDDRHTLFGVRGVIMELNGDIASIIFPGLGEHLFTLGQIAPDPFESREGTACH